MCEKFFTHIGLFRAAAAEKFKEIVDNLHVPDRGEVHGFIKTYRNLNREDPEYKRREEEEALLCDEDDPRLYTVDHGDYDD